MGTELTIGEEVDKLSWEIIEQSQLGLAEAITALLKLGQTPKQIGKHVASIASSVLCVYSIEGAAVWRERQLKAEGQRTEDSRTEDSRVKGDWV